MPRWIENGRVFRVAGLAALAIGLFLLAAAVSEAAKGKVLGAAEPTPASCPDDCLVEARVTGFQTAIGGRKNPFVVPRHGRIVAWSIKLGEPSNEDVRFFNRAFGASKARLSVLKAVRTKRGKRAYRLLRQSPVVRLRPFFGEITTFGLSKALRVRRGNIVALTIPTWVPAFGTRGDRRSRWRASRTRSRAERCFSGRASNVDAGAAHERPGTDAPYRCVYRGSRLLYSARFVAQGKRK
jgi:hypothetical protein